MLATPLGQPGSGRIRYGAAMQFHRAGRLSDAALEVYRICSANDAADPAVLLSERDATSPDTLPLTPAQHIRALIEAASAYLATHDGPGIGEVRAGIARWSSGVIEPVGRANTVVTRHLPTALAYLSATDPRLAAAIDTAAPHLPWTTYDAYDPAQVGAEFPAAHAYASLMGEATLPTEDFDFGLFLIAPHVLYRDHVHAAPELYVPLTGPHGWRFAPGAPLTVKPAHVPVWNAPDVPHLTKVGPVPFLALYAWTRDVDAVARIVPAHDWPALEALRLEATP